MPRRIILPPDEKPGPDGTKAGGWWHESDDGRRAVCDLCPRACALRPGNRGFCFVRQNLQGRIVSTTTFNGVPTLQAGQGGSVAEGAVHVDVSALDGATLADPGQAAEAVAAVRDSVSTARVDLGATQGRLEATIARLTSRSQDMAASRSRIADADIASETATLASRMILQQIGIAMLAQANEHQQSALRLLG